MYLGAASGTTVSHVSDIVGPVRTPVYLLSSAQSGSFFTHQNNISV